jgi:hypothetical protein
MSQVFVGDVGTIIQLETGVDLSSATTVTIRVKKKGEKHQISVEEWTGTVASTTKVRHVSAAGDFDVAGTYLLQAHVLMPSWEGYGGIVELPVLALA